METLKDYPRHPSCFRAGFPCSDGIWQQQSSSSTQDSTTSLIKTNFVWSLLPLGAGGDELCRWYQTQAASPVPAADPKPRQLTRPQGRLWPPPTKMSAKSHLAQGCSVNKPPPSTSASHRHQPQPKSIDEKQSVISRPHWLGYGGVRKHYRKHRCGEITSFSGAFLSLQVLPDLPQNFHVCTQSHLVCHVVVPVPVQVRCVTLGRARPA